MSQATGNKSANPVLDALRTRRVTRHFTDDPVSAEDIRTILRAGTWASSAGNRSIHRFLVIRDPNTIAGLRPFAPGILIAPPALIVLSTDTELARAQYVQLGRDMNTWIDIGTSLMCMMLAAQALDLGSCPATSFSRAAVARVLDLPANLVPELMLVLGHPAAAPGRRGTRTLTSKALTDWEHVGGPDPGSTSPAA
jgi:nitroreductase